MNKIRTIFKCTSNAKVAKWDYFLSTNIYIKITKKLTCIDIFYVMKGIGGYTIFHYFPAMLCHTMDELVT